MAKTERKYVDSPRTDRQLKNFLTYFSFGGVVQNSKRRRDGLSQLEIGPRPEERERRLAARNAVQHFTASSFFERGRLSRILFDTDRAN